MLYGIGCDICETARIAKALSGPHGAAFARRVYGDGEAAALGLGQKPPTSRGEGHMYASAAANFASKEAFLKAAGTGLAEPFSMREIEALRLPSGAPVYSFSGKTGEWVAERGLKASLSLSHEGGMALAFCVLESEN